MSPLFSASVDFMLKLAGPIATSACARTKSAIETKLQKSNFKQDFLPPKKLFNSKSKQKIQSLNA
jgi:hypothetical protein